MQWPNIYLTSKNIVYVKIRTWTYTKNSHIDCIVAGLTMEKFAFAKHHQKRINLYEAYANSNAYVAATSLNFGPKYKHKQ